MDTKELETLVEEWLEKGNLFLVEMNVSPEARVTIYADGFNSISIDQCAALSRFIRHHFGEAIDDWEITVSSPGLEKPFRHHKQYLKNLEKSVEAVTKDGQKISGKLLVAEPDFIVIQEFKPLKGKSKAQKPVLSDKQTRLEMDNIKQTKKMIIF